MTARMRLDRTRLRLTLGAALVALGIPLAMATTAAAASFVPMPIEDLTRSSVAAVIARVQAVRGVAAADGHIHTLVDLAVEEVLHGQVPASSITLREPGGRADGIAEVIDGVAVYTVGEQVVTFLGVWPDGSLRTNHLALGRWVVDRDAVGSFRARQTFGRAVALIPPPGRPTPASAMSLADLRDGSRVDAWPPPRYRPGRSRWRHRPKVRPATRPLPNDVSPFVLFNPAARFFEPDEGGTLDFLIDDRGDSILGLSVSRQAVATRWPNGRTSCPPRSRWATAA